MNEVLPVILFVVVTPLALLTVARWVRGPTPDRRPACQCDHPPPRHRTWRWTQDGWVRTCPVCTDWVYGGDGLAPVEPEQRVLTPKRG